MSVAKLLKPHLYKKPTPFFVWNEGFGGNEVWTAASLYWALRNLDLENVTAAGNSKAPDELQDLQLPPIFPSYFEFPRMLWRAAKARSSNHESFTHASILVFVCNGTPLCTCPEFLRLFEGILDCIIAGNLNEVHFVEDPKDFRNGNLGTVCWIWPDGLIEDSLHRR